MQKETSKTKDMPVMFEVSRWPEHICRGSVLGMEIVAECSSLGNGYGKKMRIDENTAAWYVCLPCVGKAVCVREDIIKPEGKSWLESCQNCGRRLQN